MAWMNQMIAMTKNWLDGKPSSPGATAEIREIERVEVQGALNVKYHVYVKGAPADQIYSEISWPINAPTGQEVMQGLSLGKDGIVMCAGRTAEQCTSPEKKDDPVEFTFIPAKGEVYRLALVSADERTTIYFALVPDPIIGTDKGCSVEVVRVLPRFEAVLIRAKGFRPKEKIQLMSKSFDETHDGPLETDNQGAAFTGIFPFVKDKERGSTDIKLIGRACAPAVSFQWGKQ